MNIANDTVGLVAAGVVVAPVSALLLPPAKSVLPQLIIDISKRYLAEPLYFARTHILRVLPHITTSFNYGRRITTNWTMLAVAATLEELMYRYLIQSVLLRELPKALLRITAPRFEHIVDNKVAKVARVIITSTAFTLAHTMRLGHLPGMLAVQFVFGLYFSYKREENASIASLSATHFAYNVVGTILAGGVNEAPPNIDLC